MWYTFSGTLGARRKPPSTSREEVQVHERDKEYVRKVVENACDKEKSLISEESYEIKNYCRDISGSKGGIIIKNWTKPRVWR